MGYKYLRYDNNEFNTGGNLASWVRDNSIVLTNDSISLFVGEELTVYGESLINLPIDNNLTIEYTCDIGTQTGNNFTITPASDDVGFVELGMIFKNSGKIFLEETIILTCYDSAPDLSLKLMMIGDSLVEIGAQLTAYGITETTGQSITWLGTKTKSDSGPYPPVNHEGKSGATWDTFANTANTPFFKDGVLDIPAYFTDNSIVTPDIVTIRLGVNDAFDFSDNLSANYNMPESALNTVLDNAKKFIDAFLAYDSNLIVLVGLPTICEDTGFGWANNYDETRYIQDTYISVIHRLHQAYVDTFASKAYSNRVDCTFEVCGLDRDDSYIKTDGVHSNGVHLSFPGYIQLGNSLGISLNKYFANQILRDGNTLGDYNSDYLTKDVNNNVSVWNDDINSNDLISFLGQPIYSSTGVTFDGSKSMRNISFTLPQPAIFYLVLKVTEWSNLDIICDGGVAGSALLIMNVASPHIYMNGGSYAAANDDLVIGNFAIIRATWDGASSKLQIGENAATTGNPGSLDIDGFSIGAGRSGANPSKIEVKRIIVRNSINYESDIYNLLDAKYNSKDF